MSRTRPILFLSPIQRDIYLMVKNRPRTAAQLHYWIWRVYPQDAPDISCIKAHIFLLNKKLCYRGERIRARRGEPYMIVKVKPHAYPERKPARDQNAAGLEGAQSAGQAGEY